MPDTDASQRDDTRLNRVEEMLASVTLRQAARLLNALTASEIAHRLEGLPRTERETLWGLMQDKDGEILIRLSDEIQADLLGRMDLAEILSSTEGLDLADLIQQVPDTVTREFLDSPDL